MTIPEGADGRRTRRPLVLRRHRTRWASGARTIPSTSTEFACSVSDVWDVIADGWLFPVWVVGSSGMRAVDVHFPAVGSQLHHISGTWPWLVTKDTTTVLEVEPLRRLQILARGWPLGEATATVTLTPHDDGCCTVDLHEDVTAGPALRLPRRIRAWIWGHRNPETLARLRAVAEQRALARIEREEGVRESERTVVDPVRQTPETRSG